VVPSCACVSIEEIHALAKVKYHNDACKVLNSTIDLPKEGDWNANRAKHRNVKALFWGWRLSWWCPCLCLYVECFVYDNESEGCETDSHDNSQESQTHLPKTETIYAMKK